MTDPLVSLIIPVYNVAPYLQACLESVERQHYAPLQVIIVDDGSTDCGGAICDDYARHHDNTVVIHTPNRGLGAARNRGLEEARGQWVVFADSDDTFSPDYIGRLVSLAAKYPEVDVAATGFIRTRDVSKSRSRAESRVTVYTPEAAAMKMLYQNGGLECSACSKLFRRELFDKLRFDETVLYEDLDLMPRVMLAAHGVVVSDVADYFYRVRGGSILGHFNRRRYDAVRVTRRLVEYMERVSPALHRAACDRHFSACCNILALLSHNGLGDSIEADDCRRVIRRLRRQVVSDPNARLKSRVGAVLACISPDIVSALSRQGS